MVRGSNLEAHRIKSVNSFHFSSLCTVVFSFYAWRKEFYRKNRKFKKKIKIKDSFCFSSGKGMTGGALPKAQKIIPKTSQKLRNPWRDQEYPFPSGELFLKETLSMSSKGRHKTFNSSIRMSYLFLYVFD